MEDKFLTEQALRKWKPVIDHKDMAPITDAHKRATIATLLENQEKAIREQILIETNNVVGNGMSPVIGNEGNIKGYDPILIQLVRRAMPNLMAYDICGVQAMSAPTGLIFAMRSKYGGTYGNTNQGAEAFFNEADTAFSGGTAAAAFNGSTGGSVARGTTGALGGTFGFVDPFLGMPGLGDPNSVTGLTQGMGMNTSVGESLTPNEMGFSIERVAVQANTRALAASYSVELAQDLKAVHGLDAETELANILSTEILAEINREVVRNVYRCAKLGAQQSDLYYKTVVGGLSLAGTSAVGGVYDLIQDSDGRWSAEKFRGLMFQIERECNKIAKDTRRGKGNFIICSADVASALAMGGFLNISPALNVSLDVDDTGNTFAGTLNGKIKVYIDPYIDTTSTSANFVCVGYKGTSPYDAGLFYCPYVPLQMMRAVDTATFQPKMAFKTRYGMVANPFAEGTAAGLGRLAQRSNQYYRIFRVDNLHGVAS
jgi:hypothetical protein